MNAHTPIPSAIDKALAKNAQIDKLIDALGSLKNWQISEARRPALYGVARAQAELEVAQLIEDAFGEDTFLWRDVLQAEIDEEPAPRGSIRNDPDGSYDERRAA